MTMASAPPQHPSANAPVPELPARRLTYLRYFLMASILPLIGFLTAFPLVCSRSYEQWGETQWGPELEFPYTPGTPDADVVIFGDSSAFLGVDPRILNRELGIRSVVLPSTVGSLPVIGDEPLRTYLAHHPKPKLLVLYFSPWNLNFQHVAKGRMFEGEEMMVRHASWPEILRFSLRHPLEMAEFPLRLYSTFGPKMVMAILHHESRTHDIAAGLGHAPYVEKFGSLTDLCRIPAGYLREHSDTSVVQLRQRYQALGMDVMVYLAPVPQCTNSRAVEAMTQPDLHAAAPRLLPPTYFAGDMYYAHVRPSSVPLATQVFAQDLKVFLQKAAPDLLHPLPDSEPPLQPSVSPQTGTP